jgi:hypothetical protein
MRATETFSLNDDDVETIDPANWSQLTNWSRCNNFNFGPRYQRAKIQKGRHPTGRYFCSSRYSWYVKLQECKREFGWIGGPVGGPVHTSRAHRLTIYDISNATMVIPVWTHNTPLATALKTSFILLECTGVVIGLKSRDTALGV